MPNFAYLTMNFGIAAILLTIIFWKKIREIKKTTILKSGILSLILTANILFDKLRIDRLPSSMCSVFAASAILIVPMILILLRKYPTKNNMVGAVIIMSGIFLILVCGFQMSPVGNPLFLILSIGGILGLIFAIF